MIPWKKFLCNFRWVFRCFFFLVYNILSEISETEDERFKQEKKVERNARKIFVESWINWEFRFCDLFGVFQCHCGRQKVPINCTHLLQNLTFFPSKSMFNEFLMLGAHLHSQLICSARIAVSILEVFLWKILMGILRLKRQLGTDKFEG